MNFAHPIWLLLLLLLPLLGAAAVVVTRLRRKQWSAFIAPRLRNALLKSGSPLPRWFSLFFLLAACAGMILALARPQGDAGVRTEKSLGRNVLIALDLSRSMRVADVKPDRLERAKMVIYELLDAMPNERVGLLGFAGSAYSYAPLTVDHQAVRETVQQIDETWATRGGSNIGAALRLAIDTLGKTGQKNNALIILSDGEKHDESLDDLIAQASESGVYILAIGVGTENGDYVPNADFPGGRMVDRNGKPVLSRLQPEVLRKLASETKGRYAVAGSSADIASMVTSTIKDLDAFEIEGRERKVMVEFYQWLLFPAMVFLFVSIIVSTRWRGVNAVLMASALIYAPTTARADQVSSAKDALEKGSHNEAMVAYQKLAADTRDAERKARFHLGEATAAYQAKDFRAARKAYSKAMLSTDSQVRGKAHLGGGKSLFQLGWYSLTENAYPSDEENAPTLADFDELARKKLEDIRNAESTSDFNSPIKTLITNWTDAVRHFHSAHAANPQDSASNHNRDLVMTYLKRLQELLEEERDQTQQSLPQPQQGEGEGETPPENPGEGEPNEDGEPQDSDSEGEKGEGDEEPHDGSGDDDEDPEKNNGEKSEDDESGKSPQDPNESPEERARRILEENSDSEKGPLSPGRIEFNPPEKDW